MAKPEIKIPRRTLQTMMDLRGAVDSCRLITEGVNAIRISANYNLLEMANRKELPQEVRSTLSEILVTERIVREASSKLQQELAYLLKLLEAGAGIDEEKGPKHAGRVVREREPVGMFEQEPHRNNRVNIIYPAAGEAIGEADLELIDPVDDEE